MRNKLFITQLTLGLTLAASVFIGCQDFLGGDKGNQAAAPSGDNLQHAAQALSAQDSAKALPAPAVDTPPMATTPPASQPAATEPVKPAPAPASITPDPVKPTPSPASTALTPEQQVCLDLYNELQTAKDPRYGEVKDQYAGKGCNELLNAVQPNPRTYTPSTIEEDCKIYRKNVITLPTTGDPKYDAYMAQEAIKCADYP